MCLILFSINQHREFPLVLAANRDEFYHRPTTPMHWWPDRNLLAGRDEQSGGTWLAVSPEGNVSAVTNVREGNTEAGRLTRGKLPLLAQECAREQVRQQLADTGSLYAGFNLIHLTRKNGWYYSNRDAHPGRTLYRGGYGLSNHLLQSPWPKLVRLREQLRQTLADCNPSRPDSLHDSLIDQLRDTSPAPDHLLPDTGLDLAYERFLSSPFIASESYGTRATTVVTIDRKGDIHVTEQAWGIEGKKGERQNFQWTIEPLDG